MLASRLKAISLIHLIDLNIHNVTDTIPSRYKEQCHRNCDVFHLQSISFLNVRADPFVTFPRTSPLHPINVRKYRRALSPDRNHFTQTSLFTESRFQRRKSNE